MNPIKGAVARTFHATGLNRFLLRLQQTSPYVRALNYHDVPPRLANLFEAQLRRYAEHFVPVGYAELEAFCSGTWPHRRPGLILSFDDGLRSHAEVVAPLLERYGFSGWFMVPTGFVDAAPEEQADYARDHQIDFDSVGRSDPRIALSWDDVRALSGRHVIACHTHSHCRLGATVSPEELAAEIDGAKSRLERVLGRAVPVFAWVGGEEEAYSAAAARAIREAGFRVAFMTNHARIRAGTTPLQLQRTNVEAHYPPSLVGLCLSGFFDVMYTAKRRRVNRLTAE